MRHLVSLKFLFVRLIYDGSASVSAEYAFLITFIAIVASLGMIALGPGIADYFTALSGLVPDASVDPVCPLGTCAS